MKNKNIVIIVLMLLILNSFGTLLGTAIYLKSNNNIYQTYFNSTDETFYSLSSDGYSVLSVAEEENKYNNIWEASVGNILDNHENISIGQFHNYILNRIHQFSIFRSFLLFDTSSIPDNANIISATISIYGFKDFSDYDFDIVVQNGQAIYPHNPLINEDYNKIYYSGNGGSMNTQDFTTQGYNHITLNSDGRSWLNKNGITKLCLRSNKDISGQEPTNDLQFEYISFYSNEKGAIFRPKLYIEYSVGNSPNKPEIPTGHTKVCPEENNCYFATTTDPDGDQISYMFDWGEGHGSSGWLSYVDSGITGSACKTWSVEDNTIVRVRAKDENNNIGPWSDELNIEIKNDYCYNSPPNIPTVSILNKGYGAKDKSYNLYFKSIDLDNDKIRYEIKYYYDDSKTTSYYESGEEVEYKLFWPHTGTYEIKVKAIDEEGCESDWSEPQTMVIYDELPDLALTQFKDTSFFKINFNDDPDYSDNYRIELFLRNKGTGPFSNIYRIDYFLDDEWLCPRFVNIFDFEIGDDYLEPGEEFDEYIITNWFRWPAGKEKGTIKVVLDRYNDINEVYEHDNEYKKIVKPRSISKNIEGNLNNFKIFKTYKLNCMMDILNKLIKLDNITS